MNHAEFKFTVHLFEYDIHFQGDNGVVENLDITTTSENDPHFEPIITLPEVTVSTMEEDEIEMIKLLVFACRVKSLFSELFGLLFVFPCKICNHCTMACFIYHIF